jgi:hypothetical protein
MRCTRKVGSWGTYNERHTNTKGYTATPTQTRERAETGRDRLLGGLCYPARPARSVDGHIPQHITPQCGLHDVFVRPPAPLGITIENGAMIAAPTGAIFVSVFY